IALARFAGAQVITTASTAEKRRRALEMGAVAAVDYTAPGWAAEVRALTGGRGVDVVVDHVGQDAFAGILEALATKGRVVFCGASSGAAATVDLIDMFARQLTL